MMYGIGDVNCNDYEKIGNIFDDPEKLEDPRLEDPSEK